MPLRDSSEDKEVQTGDKNESGFDHNSSVSLLSSGSSDVAESDMPVQSINAENVSLSSQGSLYVEVGTQFPCTPGDSILSKSSCSTTVSSSDSLTGSTQTTQAYYSTSNSQDSHDSSVNPQSVAATTENSSDSGFNPTTSKEEIVRSFQLLNTADDGSEKEDTVVARACASKSEDSEKRSVDLCDGAMQSEARASTVGAAASFTDSSACTDVTSQTGSNVVPWWQQRSFADNQISVSSVAAGAGPMPDCERLGARPKQSQVQGPPAKQVPREVIGPVADGLAGDFLARHSQNGSDTSLFDDTPTQGASFVHGMVNAYETHKALKPFFGECQAASATDPYGRLGNPLTSVASEGCERSNTAGGFSYNEYFSGSTGHVARHLSIGSNFPVHGNYSSQNPLNAANSYSLQSGFVHNPNRFAGVEPFGREPYVPLDGHLGLYSSVHGSEPFHSGMTGSSFAGSAWMGAVGTQPGHFTCGAQRYTGFSDNTSTIPPEQDKSQTPQNTSITVGNQVRSATNSDYVLSATAENTAHIDIGNSGLPVPSSASRSNGSGVVSSTTGWPALICASSNTLTVGSEVAAQGAADGNTDSLLEGCHGDANNIAGGSMLNRDFGTDSVESTDNSLLALEQRVAEACALVERVIREREEREQFGREIERKEQMIREQRARERREREEREMLEAERWPQQQDAITSGGFERSNTDGGFSYNEHFSGSTGYLAGHLPVGSNLPIHSNYLSQNPLNAANSYSLQSGFVHNPNRFAGVEPFGREPYVPLDGHLGLYSSVHGSEPFQSGMTGSSFAGSAWMGAVGTQPGHFTHGTQRYTGISDNTSTITPEQDKGHAPENASITVGNRLRSASINGCVLSTSTENNARVDIGNSGLRAPSSVSRFNVSGCGVDTSTTSWPALICAGSNTMAVEDEVAAQGTADGNTDSLLERCYGDANNNTGGSMLNRDFGTDSVESTGNSLLALEQHVAEACALVEQVDREREEREQFRREIERKEQMIREQRARERREREEREMPEAERWPLQQDAVIAHSQWLCEHYQRGYCRVRFPCCTQFYPCHRCHNNSAVCDNEEAKACHATHLKCSHCHHEQEVVI